MIDVEIILNADGINLTYVKEEKMFGLEIKGEFIELTEGELGSLNYLINTIEDMTDCI